MAFGKAKRKSKMVSYAKWGYIFLIPFVVAFIVFQLYPLFTTFYYSFFEYFKPQVSDTFVGPNFVGLENYKTLFTNSKILVYLKNTVIMWILGFIPQIIISLLFAYWFTNNRLNLKRTGIFKSIIYMPNLIMASAFAMLMFSLFSNSETGPINSILTMVGFSPIRAFDTVGGTWGVVALMNFMMWFGNTTILLMAAMMGLNYSLIEAAEIDGASQLQIFFKITLPLIKPVLIYVLITSLIGGLQMFDVPQILTNGKGSPNNSAMTVIMYLNLNLTSRNYGVAGAISVFMFVICSVFSLIVYYFFSRNSASSSLRKKV